MRYCTTKDFEKRQDHFVCANYRSNTGNCTAHFIRSVVLEEMVLQHMQMVISYVANHETHFRAVMEKHLKLASDEAIRVSKSYEDEQAQLMKDVDALATEIAQQEQHANDVDRFVEQTKKYAGLEELTPYALHEMIKAIYIEAPDKSSGKRRQSIHISYDFVGFIPIHELMKEEMA